MFNIEFIFMETRDRYKQGTFVLQDSSLRNSNNQHVYVMYRIQQKKTSEFLKQGNSLSFNGAREQRGFYQGRHELYICKFVPIQNSL